jgi:5-methyltetrahydropteroyltriglutamate--homocysteine methyltransferase
VYHADQLVISIEASKADLKLLDVFKAHGYSNEIGPGVYDIHSPVSLLTPKHALAIN